MNFDYKKAFSRNLGWVTPEEQKLIAAKTVAIAGLGGVGGIHLVTLLRMGFQNFHLADFDFYELHNFNRQAGAFISTVGKSKLTTMVEIAKDINPQVNIKEFPEGVSKENCAAFLKDVDLFLDGLDFFCFDLRSILFSYCYDHHIPAVTAAPLGMGSTVVNFMPGKMTFDEYFGFSNVKTVEDKSILFVIGLSPFRIQNEYLVYPEIVDFEKKQLPSTPIACQMASALAATEILKILLKRGKVICAPYSMQVDPYVQKVKISWIPFGFKNPIQQLRVLIGRWIFKNKISKVKA
ncbi:MAG: ThiF family adenylyltransferase [Bdellovibrionaceae bacterium]|nr:ThiF family adenylyltransferase [Pseudobdellovibrionaceae bacterium]